MDIRKVHQKGNGSIGVTFPVGECRRMGVVPGTCMILECIEGRIVLTPVSTARQDPQETGAATNPEVCTYD